MFAHGVSAPHSRQMAKGNHSPEHLRFQGHFDFAFHLRVTVRQLLIPQISAWVAELKSVVGSSLSPPEGTYFQIHPRWRGNSIMNFLPSIEHIEVILLSGILATTAMVTVTAFVLSAVFLATREPSHSHQLATAPKVVPPSSTTAGVPSSLATAG
ncbi:MAG: hypothetical protein C0467_17945 [Planctomycetaceae bacterium]|nr:hypothetical protein [Planctomycetaceae bacterium]